VWDGVEHHLSARKAGGAVANQAEGVVGRQIHQQSLGGDEHAVFGLDPVHPTVVKRRLGQLGDAVVAGKQLFAQRHD